MNRSVAVVGLGAVGGRVAASLQAAGHQVRAVPRTGGIPLPSTDVAVLCTPVSTQLALVREILDEVPLLVTTTDEPEEVRALLALAPRASTVVVGAAFGPGLSCALAAVAMAGLDDADEIHVARYGTGGPACARQHHRALSLWGTDRRDGRWVDRPGGSGRELCWFPEPVRAQDCYRANLPDVFALHHAFATVPVLTARMAATRRDRLTSWLPMLRPPHPEGLVGAIRVEVRGSSGGARQTRVLGASAPPAVAAAEVAAWVAAHAELGRAQVVTCATFAGPLARAVAARGVTISEFDGLS